MSLSALLLVVAVNKLKSEPVATTFRTERMSQPLHRDAPQPVSAQVAGTLLRSTDCAFHCICNVSPSPQGHLYSSSAETTMVAIGHTFLLGQEVQIKRSDGRWDDAIITDVIVAQPERFWEFPNPSDHIKVIFADRMTKSILLQQDLSEVLRPACDLTGLIARRRGELFARLPPEVDEVQDVPDIEQSQQELQASPERKRKAQQDKGSTMERPVHQRLSPKQNSRPPVPVFQPALPRCLMDDDDLFDDETFHEACKLAEQDTREAMSSSHLGPMR